METQATTQDALEQESRRSSSYGLSAERKLRRNPDHVHNPRKMWVIVECTDAGDAVPEVPLANCRMCRSNKKWRYLYIAAAHLRRAHFNPRKGRRGKYRSIGSGVASADKRSGYDSMFDPPMDVLKKWMKEVDVLEPLSESPATPPTYKDSPLHQPEQLSLPPSTLHAPDVIVGATVPETNQSSDEVVCVVCMEALRPELFPKRRITSTCQHEPKTCLDCLARSVQADFQDKGYSRIRCPECLGALEFEDVKLFANPELFARYDNLMTRKALESLPNFRWCLGPNCSSGQVHSMGDAEPIVICESCGFDMCFVHQVPWHKDGISCAEWDVLVGDKNSQDVASAKLLRESTKACPNPSCGWRIQKIDGCDQMTSDLEADRRRERWEAERREEETRGYHRSGRLVQSLSAGTKIYRTPTQDIVDRK
ncbi:hypothetical protein GP486_002920 [Trichoglossum hirsutum]|uniref:RING-type domain-containing protein n=1 Tax=Trichoglossum hirsutum TaxID=265104 RepID=A0A9P8LDW3_9PEZI|nr:hypothetical protein GP486_002920 [Trichoglossum hirsutum]